jgi:hypothetical protein
VFIKLTFEDSCKEKSQCLDNSWWSFDRLDIADHLLKSSDFLLWVSMFLNGELIEVEGHGVEAIDVLFLKEIW